MLLHLIQLAKYWRIPAIPEHEQSKLLAIAENFWDDDYIAIYKYDHVWRNDVLALEHDVRAVEMFLREKFRELELDHLIPYIHILCTSEDVNNIAYQVNLRNTTNDIMLPKLRGIIQPLLKLVNTHKSDTVLWRTHGQEASPTTFWKLIAVELSNLQKAMKPLLNIKFSWKFSWATGSNADHKTTFPTVDWIEYEEEFVEQFGLSSDIISDQRGSLMERVELFQVLQNINNVLINLAGKLHDLCSRRILLQKLVGDESGSSVMPGKINPWRLEELKGVLIMANKWFQAAIDTHNITLRERDLSEHPLERNYGDSFGQMLIGMTNMIEQLSRFEFSSENADKELDHNPEIIGSGIQNILREKEIHSAYNFLTKLMKGRNVTLDDIHDFISFLASPTEEKIGILESSTEAVKDMESKFEWEEREEFYKIVLDDSTRDKLLALDPKTYIGDCSRRSENLSKSLIWFMWKIDTNVTLILDRPRLMVVGWDFDDTLYLWDKEELEARMRFILQELGVKFSDDEVMSIVSKARWDEQKSWLIQIAWKKGQRISDARVEELQEQARPQFNHLLKMDDYALETLDLLQRKNIPQFLVTNRWPKTLWAAIKKHDLSKYFPYIADASHALKKPDPQLMWEVFTHFWLSKWSNVRYVGDHAEYDVRFAQNSWVTPIHVNRWWMENIKGVKTVKDMWELFRSLSLELL